MREMIKNSLIMLAITLVAGLGLGAVYQLTKDTIAERERQTVLEAYKQVFPDAADFKEQEVAVTEEQKSELKEAGINNSDIYGINTACDANGEVLGYVLSINSHGGYGGDITFTVGIRNDGTVNGVKLLSINETPGLGMNAEAKLIPQFAGKNVDFINYTKTGATADNEVDAISGATITTRTVTDGVNLAIVYFNKYLEGGNL